MYCDFFGLRCRPFEDRADTEFYFTTPEHDEALASIEYEARYGHGLALLVGEPGTGKTLLVRTLLRKLAATDRAVVLTWSASGQGDLVRETCKGFGISLPASHQTSRLSTRLTRHLKRSRQAGHRSILVIDQAENLTSHNLGELETILDSQREGESSLSIILAAAPRFRETLGKPQFASLQQKLFGERTLVPLTLEQTSAYVLYRLRVSGAGERQPFAPDAIGPIFEASKGNPRLINRLCHAAMLATYGSGKSTIGRDVAFEVASTECGIERSVDATQLGLTSPSTAQGWRPEGANDLIDSGSPARPATPSPVSNEWGDPHIDIGAAAFDSGDQTSRETVSSSGVREDYGQDARAASVSSVILPGAANADVLVNRLERATARAERSGATTEASIAQHTAIEKHLTVLNVDGERLVGRLAETVHKATSALASLEGRYAAFDASTEEQVQGLEENVSRASRIAANLQQQLANVTDACREGERVQEQLTQFADELADKAHGVQERVTQLMAGIESSDAAERRIETLLEQVANVSAQTDTTLQKECSKLAVVEEQAVRTLKKTAEAAVEQIHEALDQKIKRVSQEGEAVAEDVLQRIDKMAQDTATRAAGTEERVIAVVDRASARVSEAREKVGGLVRQAARCVAETEKAVTASGAGLDAIKEDAGRFEEEFIQASVERVRTQLEAQVSQHLDNDLETRKAAIEAVLQRAASVAADADRAVSAITQKFDDKKADIETFVENFTSRAFEESRLKLEAQFDTQLKAMEARVAASQAEMEATRATYEEATSMLRTNTAELIRDTQGQIEDVQARRDDLTSSLASLSEGVSRTLVEASDLGATVQSVSASVEQLAGRAQAAESGLVHGVVEAERLLGETHSVRGQLETLQESATRTLVNVGRAAEQMSSLQQQTHVTDSLIDQMDNRHRECEEIVERLSAQNAGAKEFIHRGDLLASRIDGQTKKLDVGLELAGSLVHELEDANAVGKNAHKEICQSIQRAETVVGEAGRQRSHLDASLKAIQSSSTRLDDVVDAATQLHDAMQGLVSHADDKVARLDSHHAAASQVASKISEMTVAGRELLDRLLESKRGSEKTVDRIERMTTDAWNIAGNAETRSTELAQMSDKLEHLVSDMEQRVTPVSELMTRLDEGVNTAEAQAGVIDERCKEAIGLAGRLEEISEIVQAAKVVDTTLRSSHDDAQHSLEQLQQACEGADGHVTALTEIKDGVVEMGERYDRSKEEAQWITQRLAEQMKAAEESFDKCEPQLSEFLEQVRMAWEFLRDLESRGKQLEDRLAASIEKPGEIVVAAQAQAAELERVCSAVRKIFSGLSKASLEARQQINECRETNETASKQILQLTSQTDRAANTLHEWVQEAVRVQARLEDTIQQTPSIRETHPGETLRAMSLLTTAAPRMGALNSTPDAATRLEPASDGAGTLEPKHTRAKNLANEVAGLIRDAKRTAGETK